MNFALVAVAALLTEAAVLRLRGRTTRHALRDCSALVTAALLSFALPPFVPFWIPLIGGAIAITLAKQLYGGLGKNLFNPGHGRLRILDPFVSRRDDAVVASAHG